MRKLLLLIFSLCLFASVEGQIIRANPFARAQASAVASTLNNNIIAYYPADETSGTTLTDAVSDNDFTTSNITWSSGMVFNDAADYVTRANDADLANLGGAFTVSFWVNLSSLPSTEGRNYTFYTQEDGDDPYHFIRISSSQFNDYLYFAVATAGGVVNASSSTAFSTGVLYHVVCTYDGSNLHIYRNTTEISDDPAQTGNILVADNLTAIGNINSWDANQGIEGTMRCIGIWSRALTTDEIAELYNSGTPTNYPF